jgi:hypothetical protein
MVLAVLAAGCFGGKSADTEATPEATPGAPPAVAPGDTTGLTRIRFARGTTSGIVSDSLDADQTRGYLLGAVRGQVMMVHAIIWPPRQGAEPAATARVQVFSLEDGGELSAALGEGPDWSGRLPASGDYVVRVSASAPTAYTLAMQIPRRLAPGASGPTAAIVGAAPTRAPVDYIIQGSEGQTLAASIPAGDPATLHIYGLDRGNQLAPLAERRKEWAGPLPSSQDYIVSVVPADEGASYELTVTVR